MQHDINHSREANAIIKNSGTTGIKMKHVTGIRVNLKNGR